MGNVVRLARPETLPPSSLRKDRVRLTKRLVESLQPGPVGDRVVWDGDIPGFGIRVKPNGSRSYLIQYRNAGGRSRRFTLGRHGVLTAETARDLAREKLADVRKGGDPASERAARREAPTIALLCDRYLAEYSELHNKPSSVRQNRGIITRRIKPAFGGMKISELTRDDVMRFHGSLHGTPYDANRCLALISKMMNLAEVWGLRPLNSNPCRHVRRFKEEKRSRFLTHAELARVGEALAKAETERQVRPSVALAIRLYLLTGCRRGEVLNFEWAHVDFGRGTVRLVDAKTGGREVPLGTAALDLLRSAPRSGRYVVAGPQADKPLGANTVEDGWAKIRQRAGLDDVRIHDLRHTLGTHAALSGANAFVVRDLLGHKTLTMAGRYVERYIDPLRAAADDVTGKIAAAMATGKRS